MIQRGGIRFDSCHSRLARRILDIRNLEASLPWVRLAARRLFLDGWNKEVELALLATNHGLLVLSHIGVVVGSQDSCETE